jgi:hypothetical protein
MQKPVWAGILLVVALGLTTYLLEAPKSWERPPTLGCYSWPTLVGQSWWQPGRIFWLTTMTFDRHMLKPTLR